MDSKRLVSSQTNISHPLQVLCSYTMYERSKPPTNGPSTPPNPCAATTDIQKQTDLSFLSILFWHIPHHPPDLSLSTYSKLLLKRTCANMTQPKPWGFLPLCLVVYYLKLNPIHWKISGLSEKSKAPDRPIWRCLALA